MDRKDFEKVLCAPDFFEFWQSKSVKEVGILVGKYAAAMINFDQCNPHHCYTLFEHALCTVIKLRGILQQNNECNIYLLTAAFFHDAGKVVTARMKDGRKVFYGHAVKSVQLTIPVLQKMGYDKDEIAVICFYIKHHDDFISYRLPEQITAAGHRAINSLSVWNHIEKVESTELKNCAWYSRKMWLELVWLCCADAEAQAEIVYKNNQQVDSREAKIQRLKCIENIIENRI